MGSAQTTLFGTGTNPKEEQQRQYFCGAEQSKTPLRRCRRPFVKISSHKNMRSCQKVEKTWFFELFSQFYQNLPKKSSSKVKLLNQAREKQQGNLKTTHGSSVESPITYISVGDVSKHTELFRRNLPVHFGTSEKTRSTPSQKSLRTKISHYGSHESVHMRHKHGHS